MQSEVGRWEQERNREQGGVFREEEEDKEGGGREGELYNETKRKL